jgi:hypothetical protein
MFDRLISLLVSVALAILVWLYARTRDPETLDSVPVPVQVSLPPGEAGQYQLEVNGPGYVPASFTGPPSRIHELRDQLRRGEMGVNLKVTIPPDWRGEGRILDTIRVTTADLHPPPGIRAQVVEGLNRIPVTLRKIVERRLPVRVDHGLHDRLLDCTAEPATVLVRGPQDVLERAAAIPTRPFVPPSGEPASALREVTVQGTATVVTELEGQPVQTNPSGVAVKLTLRPARRQYDVQVPVHFLCPANWGFQPRWMQKDERTGRINLKVEGPPIVGPPQIVAYVDLTKPAFQAERDVTQVLYSDEPVRVQLPPDFALAQDPPASAPFLLVPLEPGRLPLFGGGLPPP